MGIARRRKAQQPLQQDLARRRVGEVGAADDLADVLRRVVDDDSELIGVDTVSTNDDEVVDHAALGTQQLILELDPLPIRAQAQREPLSGFDAPPPLRGRELAAGARIGALGQLAVGRRGGLADLSAGAEARVQPAGCVQLAERVVVEPVALRLAHGLLVPVEPERAQVGEL